MWIEELLRTCKDSDLLIDTFVAVVTLFKSDSFEFHGHLHG